MTRRGAVSASSRRSPRNRSLRHDESGVFVVVEAVLVAVVVLTAILFYTSVQRPVRSGSQGSADLGQVSADLLSILRRHDVRDPEDPTGPKLPMQSWVTRIMAGDTEVAADVQDFLDQIVPSGARYVLRLNNGRGTLDLLPTTRVGTPAGAQASETPLFPLWAAHKLTPSTGEATADDPGLTSVSPGVTAADIGKMVTSDALPACARIAEVTAPDALSLSVDSGPDTGPVSFTIEDHWRAVADAVLDDGVTAVTSATAGFSAADIGRKVSGEFIPPCTTIVAVTSVTEATLSLPAEMGADPDTPALLWIEPPTAQPGDQVDAGQIFKLTQNSLVKCIRAPAPSIAGTEGSSLAPGAVTVPDGVTDGTTALSSTSANWKVTDIGRPITGTGIPSGTTITARVSATQVTMSQASPAGAGIVLTMGNTWLSHWQGSQTAGVERIPAGTPYGMWAGFPNSDCTGTAIYGRLALPGAATPDDYPIYGLQLVVWYGA